MYIIKINFKQLEKPAAIYGRERTVTVVFIDPSHNDEASLVTEAKKNLRL
jgi:hypothetical protein